MNLKNSLKILFAGLVMTLLISSFTVSPSVNYASPNYLMEDTTKATKKEEKSTEKKQTEDKNCKKSCKKTCAPQPKPGCN